MSAKAKRKPRKSTAPEPKNRYGTIWVEQFEALLGDLEHCILEGVTSYGMIRGGVPFTNVPTIPEVLSDLAIKVKILRTCVANAERRGGKP